MRREDLLGASVGERLAVAVFVAAYLALLVLMPGWRATDAPDPAAYAMTPQDFVAWEEDYAARHAANGGEVRPVPGDVPVLARRFAFTPPLRLKVGRTYHLHLSSADTVHSAWIDGKEVLLIPGQVDVITVTPTRSGQLELRCGEYCGLGHSRMRGSITAVP